MISATKKWAEQRKESVCLDEISEVFRRQAWQAAGKCVKTGRLNYGEICGSATPAKFGHGRPRTAQVAAFFTAAPATPKNDGS